MESWKRTLYAAWSAQLIAILGFSFVLPFLPLYVQTLGVSDLRDVELWAGLLGLAAGVPMALCAPVWGALADRYGRKVMVERSMFAGAVFVTAMGLVTDVNQLLILRILQGAFTGTISASVALVATVVPRDKIGYSLGLMQMAVYTGMSTGPLLGGLLSDFVGFRVSFWATGALLLLAGLIVLFLVDERFQPADPQGRISAGDFLDSLSATLSSRQLLPLILVVFSIQISVQIVGPILPLFVQSLSDSGPYVASMSGSIMAVAGVTSAVSAIALGFLGDKVGHRRVLTLSALAAGLTYIPQALVRGSLELLMLRGLMGLFIGGMLPSANALIGKLTPIHRRGSVYGVSSSAGAWGNALGPMLGGSIAAGLGLRSVFITTAAILVVMGVWVSMAIADSEEEIAPSREESRETGDSTDLPG